MVDPLGLTIFLIGLGFLVAELASPGYFLGVPGTTGVIIGLIQMTWTDFFYGNNWSPFVVFGVATLSFFASLEFYRRFAPAVKPPETLSSDALMGKGGIVVRRVLPNSLEGKVKVGGIVWSATGARSFEEGEEVVVSKVDGVHVEVETAHKIVAPKSAAGAKA